MPRLGESVIVKSGDFRLNLIPFGHTGHTAPDANVCLLGTRRDILSPVKYFAWDDAKNAKLRADRGIG
ncbi:MAG TPA: hypothetical protein VGP40_02070, partial [Chthoniobacterales bacterium]|nr:hypothetical protein [Chthoniobacterales bacterium]